MSEPAPPPAHHRRSLDERHRRARKHARNLWLLLPVVLVVDAAFWALRLFVCWDTRIGGRWAGTCGGAYALSSFSLLLGVLSLGLLIEELIALGGDEHGVAGESRRARFQRGLASLRTRHRMVPVAAIFGLALLALFTALHLYWWWKFEVLFPRRDATGALLKWGPLVVGGAVLAALLTAWFGAGSLRWMGLSPRNRKVLFAWLASFYAITFSFAGVAVWALARPDFGTDALVKLLVAGGGFAWFVFKVFSGQLNANLAIELKATASRAGPLLLELSLEKKDVGAIELVSIAFADAATSAFLELAQARTTEFRVNDDGVLIAAPQPGGRPVTLLPGDKASFAWSVTPALPAGAVVEVAISARRHPLHFLWFHPQWRASTVVRQAPEGKE